jgi:predicted dehydrogenase
MNKVRVGIIGTGGISNVHINGYKSLENAEVYAVCDIDEEKVKASAEKHGVKHVFTDYNEMLKLKELDAISVCTWNSEHAPAAIASLKAGKHVLCEKPMAMNTNEAIEMDRVSKEYGKLLMIGFTRRFADDTKVIKDFIENGMMGDIYYAKAAYLRRAGYPGGWFGDKKRSGGGPLIDLGVHIIDIVRYFMGLPKVASVKGVTFDKLGARTNIIKRGGYTSTERSKVNIFDVEDLAVAIIKFDNDAVLSVETSFSLNTKSDTGGIELFGTKAGVNISRTEPKIEFFTEQNNYLINVAPTINTQLSFQELFQKETAHFVDCVANGTKCISPAEDGIELMRIIDGVYESAKTGREVIF